MIKPEVWTFFYSSYMNFDVLREVDLAPEQWQVNRRFGDRICSKYYKYSLEIVQVFIAKTWTIY